MKCHAIHAELYVLQFPEPRSFRRKYLFHFTWCVCTISGVSWGIFRVSRLFYVTLIHSSLWKDVRRPLKLFAKHPNSNVAVFVELWDQWTSARFLLLLQRLLQQQRTDFQIMPIKSRCLMCHLISIALRPKPWIVTRWALLSNPRLTSATTTHPPVKWTLTLISFCHNCELCHN